MVAESDYRRFPSAVVPMRRLLDWPMVKAGRRQSCRAQFTLQPRENLTMNAESSFSWGLSNARMLLRVHEFGSKGRGVVAAENISAGQLIERAPVLVIPAADRKLVDESIIFTYVFMWENDTVEEDLYKHTGRAGIALGYVSLLNHSYEPNVDFVRHIDHNFIDLIAKQDILAGEELTIAYQMTLWFDPL